MGDFPPLPSSTVERLLRIANAFRGVIHEVEALGENDALFTVRSSARSGLERVEALLDLMED